MRGVSRCLLVPRGTRGAREQTIETRGDPVLQGADEDSWARAVDLEATLLWRRQDGVERHGCRKVLVVALHYILKCDVDIRKDLYANVVLHHSVRVIGERMTENSLHRLPCRPENDDVASAGSHGMLGVPALSCQDPKQDMPVA